MLNYKHSFGNICMYILVRNSHNYTQIKVLFWYNIKKKKQQQKQNSTRHLGRASYPVKGDEKTEKI